MTMRSYTEVIEDAQLMDKNFAGREGRYNREGDRNFVLILNPDYLDREWKTRVDPYGIVSARVHVSDKGERPSVITVDGVELPPEEWATMDVLKFKKVDVMVFEYHWEISGHKGIKLYLAKLEATR